MTDRRTSDAPLRVLYIYPDTMGPHQHPPRNALHHLRGYLRGDMIPVFVPGGEGLRQIVRDTRDAIGDFAIHPINTQVTTPIVRQLIEVSMMLREARRLRLAGHAYDAILAHGPYRTGYVGLLLSWLWRLPLVVEFPGHPLRALTFDTTRLGRLKQRIAPSIVRWLINRTDAIRLLFPSQLDEVPGLDRKAVVARSHVFHEFVPISEIRQSEAPKELALLFVGFPWHLKGVDVLIAAFHQISAEFPSLKLRIVGFCPDPAPWHALARGDTRIEFHPPMLNTAVAELMAASTVFVLPSRSEAMGRVLLEAMAAGTAVIGSRVDGIPHYVDDEVTGLTFDVGDVNGLANALRRLLTDTALRERLVTTALARVRAEYGERAYAEAFFATVQDACARRARERR